MIRPTRLTAVLLTTAAAVVAPTAAAHAATTPSAKTVAAHVQKSHGAQLRVATLARRGDVKGARRVLRTARSQAMTASREARVLAAGADDQDSGAQAAWALAAAAGNDGSLVHQATSMVPDISGLLQQALAAALPPTLANRDALIAELTQLAQRLQGQVSDLVDQTLKALTATMPSDAAGLSGVASLDGLPQVVSGLIDSALKIVKTACDSVSAVLGTVSGTPSGGATTTGAGSVPSGGVLSGLLNSIAGLVPGLGGLFGGLPI